MQNRQRGRIRNILQYDDSPGPQLNVADEDGRGISSLEHVNMFEMGGPSNMDPVQITDQVVESQMKSDADHQQTRQGLGICADEESIEYADDGPE